MWKKHDQILGDPLKFEDNQISDIQNKMRIKSQTASAKHLSRDAPKEEFPKMKIGDLIYIKSDGSKNKAR